MPLPQRKRASRRTPLVMRITPSRCLKGHYHLDSHTAAVLPASGLAVQTVQGSSLRVGGRNVVVPLGHYGGVVEARHIRLGCRAVRASRAAGSRVETGGADQV